MEISTQCSYSTQPTLMNISGARPSPIGWGGDRIMMVMVVVVMMVIMVVVVVVVSGV